MSQLIELDEKKCVGCNQCINVCPVDFANVAYLDENGNNKIRVDQQRCIHCGACIAKCSEHHGARSYKDDTEKFFEDLNRGVKISVIAAPAVRFNFSDYQAVFGYLKSLGVHLIYDVSFGADITTWAYLKAIAETKTESVIAQPCPAIVNYVEKYVPSLIVSLAPVHSPALCTAVYMRKYANITDKIAFLSPCFGKSDEFIDVNTEGYVSYNVTYKKIQEYMDAKRVRLSLHQKADFDDPGCGLGLTFSRPGGLRENVQHHVPDAWVRQTEGTHHAYEYLCLLYTSRRG